MQLTPGVSQAASASMIGNGIPETADREERIAHASARTSSEARLAAQSAWVLGRLRWFLLPPTVFLTWTLVLHLLYRSDRDALLQRRPEAVAFGDGILLGQALLLTLGSACLSLILASLLAAPSALRVVAVGILGVLVAPAIDELLGAWIEAHLGGRTRFHGATLLGIAALFALWRLPLIRRRGRHAG